MPLSHAAHVLIVDDERYIAEMIQSLLARYSITAMLAETGEEALKILADADFDVIISDHYLDGGGLSGLDLVEAVRAMGRNTPFFVATACIEDEILDSLRFHPMVRALFRKPFDIMALLKRVSEAVEESKTRARAMCQPSVETPRETREEPRQRTVLGG